MGVSTWGMQPYGHDVDFGQGDRLHFQGPGVSTLRMHQYSSTDVLSTLGRAVGLCGRAPGCLRNLHRQRRYLPPRGPGVGCYGCYAIVLCYGCYAVVLCCAVPPAPTPIPPFLEGQDMVRGYGVVLSCVLVLRDAVY
eukprot:157023-Rhodomonas_salina.2